MTSSALYSKLLSVEKWSEDDVCEWLKGIQPFAFQYLENFRNHNVNGKKLAILDMSDLNDLVGSNLSHKLAIFKSINNLIQLKYDLNRDTLHSLLFMTANQMKSMCMYIERLVSDQQSSTFADPNVSARLKHDLVKNSALLALTYRKLITWLARMPFTKLKDFNTFRESINAHMKTFLKTFRKKVSDGLFEDIKQNLEEMRQLIVKMMDFCDACCEKENGKISVAFNYCYLERVLLKKRNLQQELGLSLTSLVDGVYTIAEIQRGSAADDCSRLNVEDDIVAINNQIVIGWQAYNVSAMLKELFTNDHALYLLLRKMPKDHLTSIKQQQQQNNHKAGRLESRKQKRESQYQRKHSFSDIFLAEDYMLDYSSEEETEEEEDVEFNRLMSGGNTASVQNLNDSSQLNQSSGNIYQKFKSKAKDKQFTSKLAKKSNRLIRSMQNLANFRSRSRSRSNSADSMTSNETTSASKNGGKSSKKSSKNDLSAMGDDSKEYSTGGGGGGGGGKSDLIKSLFSNKKWELGSPKKNRLHTSESSSDAPSLVNIKRLNSMKRRTSNGDAQGLETYETVGGGTSSRPRQLVSQSSDDSQSTNNNNNTKVSSKPPLSKRAASKQPGGQKPQLQGWLYKRKQVKLSTSNSSLNSLGSSTTNLPQNQMMTNGGTLPVVSSLTGSLGSGGSSGSSSSHLSSTAALIRNHLGSKWKLYWSVLVKDYIAFYKNQDEKIPVDFLLLKDFSMSTSKNNRENGFVLTDRQKQLDHEFYAPTSDEFKEWLRVLNELPTRAYDQMSASSSTSLSSMTANNNNNGQDLETSVMSGSPSQSLPSTFGRKNNHHLQLSTILDYDTDQYGNFLPPGNNGNNTTAATIQQSSSTNASPTLVNNNNNTNTLQPQSLNSSSSRESSPGLLMKPHHTRHSSSRDASPSLAYPYTQEADNMMTTSESDGEIAFNSKSKKGIGNKSRSHAAIASAAITAAATSSAAMASCSSSPSSAASQSVQFTYEDDHINKMVNSSLPHRANSLPGSLQSCVGSFIVPNEGKKKSRMTQPAPPPPPPTTATPTVVANPPKEIQPSSQPAAQPIFTLQPDSPSNVMPPKQITNKPPLVNSQASFNITNNNSNNKQSPSKHVVSSNSAYQTSTLSSHSPSQPPTQYSQLTSTTQYTTQHKPSQLSHQGQPQYFYFPSSQSHQIIQLPNMDHARKISVQLGPHGGLTCIKTSSSAADSGCGGGGSGGHQPFIFTTLKSTGQTTSGPKSQQQQQQQPQQHQQYQQPTTSHQAQYSVVQPFTQHLQQQYHQQQQQATPVSPSVLFRTEMTILPSSFNKNNNNNSNNNNNNNNNSSKQTINKPPNKFTFSKNYGT